MRYAAVVAAALTAGRRSGFVVTTTDLRRVGANSRQITQMERDGLLLRPRRGVYVIPGAPRGHALAVRIAMASTKGTPAVASHASAAWLQGILDKAPSVVHLSSAAVSRRGPGFILHHSDRPVTAVHRFQQIPCTAPARTLVDLAASAPPALIAQAVDQALAAGIVRLRDLEAEAATPGRRGVAQLRDGIAALGPSPGSGAPPPSVLETRMRRLLRSGGLPDAAMEHVAGPDGEYRIDLAYPEHRLAVELYGYRWHHSRAQMQRDHRRQRRLTLEGWTILVFTWDDVVHEPDRVAAELGRALERGGRDRTARGGGRGENDGDGPGSTPRPPLPSPKPSKVDNQSRL